MRYNPLLCGVLFAMWLALCGANVRAQDTENPVGGCAVQKPMSPVSRGS
jgi:hypothetical protein